jgi:hypothetical protein
MQTKYFTLAVGTPFNGFKFYGPFVSHDIATDWADKITRDGNYWVIETECPCSLAEQRMIARQQEAEVEELLAKMRDYVDTRWENERDCYEVNAEYSDCDCHSPNASIRKSCE